MKNDWFNVFWETFSTLGGEMSPFQRFLIAIAFFGFADEVIKQFPKREIVVNAVDAEKIEKDELESY